MKEFSFNHRGLIVTAGEDVLRQFMLDRLNGSESAHRALRIPRIGERWEGQGGFNGGLARGTVDVPDHFLIVSPSEGYFDDVQFGGYGTDETDAVDEWDGLKNTQALLKQGSHPAAEKCAGFTCEGHSDYFLGAKRQMALLYGTVPEQFEKEWHWTSTRVSANIAWSQNFSRGSQDWIIKDGEFRCRALRRLFLSDLIL